MGPLALLDLIGLDTAQEILDTIYTQGRERSHAPRPILRQMVSAGMRGHKTGHGFYTYQQPNSPVLVDEEPVREVGVIGVVGSGESAMRIATELSAAGIEILRADRDDTPSDLAGADLIVVGTTSTAPVIDYAVTTYRQADVVGLHLFDGA